MCTKVAQKLHKSCTKRCCVLCVIWDVCIIYICNMMAQQWQWRCSDSNLKVCRGWRCVFLAGGEGHDVEAIFQVAQFHFCDLLEFLPFLTQNLIHSDICFVNFLAPLPHPHLPQNLTLLTHEIIQQICKHIPQYLTKN